MKPHFRGWDDDRFATWMAGFFDGEGCVHIHDGKRGRALRISVASTDRRIIHSIYRRLGFGVMEVTEFVDQPRWRTKHELRVHRFEDALSFLQMVRPHLTIKARKADEALALIAAFVERRHATFARHRRMRELRAAGWTNRRIADSLGVSPSLVSLVCASEDERLFKEQRPAFHRRYRQRGVKPRASVRTRSKKIA